MPSFIVTQCGFCETFQVRQRAKSGKFACSVCGERNSVRRVYAEAIQAKPLREVARRLNARRGAAEDAALARAVDAVRRDGGDGDCDALANGFYNAREVAHATGVELAAEYPALDGEWDGEEEFEEQDSGASENELDESWPSAQARSADGVWLAATSAPGRIGVSNGDDASPDGGRGTAASVLQELYAEAFSDVPDGGQSRKRPCPAHANGSLAVRSARGGESPSCLGLGSATDRADAQPRMPAPSRVAAPAGDEQGDSEEADWWS